MALFDFLERLVHVLTLFGKNCIELVQTCGCIGNVGDLLGEGLELFRNGVDIGLQSRHPFFQRDNGRSGFAVFFVQPFEAFDDLFKFHDFLRRVPLISLITKRLD
jgi:hypothetical protein